MGRLFWAPSRGHKKPTSKCNNNPEGGQDTCPVAADRAVVMPSLSTRCRKTVATRSRALDVHSSLLRVLCQNVIGLLGPS